MSTWQLQDAKNRFSAVVEAALAGEPQEVTRRGQPVVVVVSCAEYRRLRQNERPRQNEAENAPSFVDHLLAIPRGSEDDGFELPRRNLDYAARAVDL